MTDKPKYYWDACLFLEKLRQESVSAEKIKAREDILNDNKDRKNIIITSVITHAEVIPKKLTVKDDEAEKTYLSMFDAKKIVDVDINRNVITLARHIKDFYYRPKEDGSGGQWVMDTGDAIHIATAIINEVDEFHTRDNSKKKGKVPLLSIHEMTPNGKICEEFELKILSPETAQGEMDV